MNTLNTNVTVEMENMIGSQTKGHYIKDWKTIQDLNTYISRLEEGEYGWIALASMGTVINMHFKVTTFGPVFTNASFSNNDIEWLNTNIGRELALKMTRGRRSGR